MVPLKSTWLRHGALHAGGELVIYELDTVAGKETNLQRERK